MMEHLNQLLAAVPTCRLSPVPCIFCVSHLMSTHAYQQFNMCSTYMFGLHVYSVV